MNNEYPKRQVALFFGMLLVGWVVGLAALLADFLFSRPDVPRAIALSGFIDPLVPMAWLFITWVLLLGMEVLGIFRSWLESMRRNVAEAFISVWGWLCGFACTVFPLSVYLGQTDAREAVVVGVTLIGMSITIIAIDGALDKISRTKRDARAIRWIALAFGVLLIILYPIFAPMNGAGAESECEVQGAHNAQSD
ncbi:hypothetical protein [Paracoccus xiamenensis]|uniref:hypothetical protein n=1 Tax=Paracoccus xiamenensis TaxID=2714901 RepID=UPI00140BEA84|nr:hypothetical protein [Paracoccus xiamenensis]NHF71737.1 hypothetical protein [Paracoccus xiamenensis]